MNEVLKAHSLFSRRSAGRPALGLLRLSLLSAIALSGANAFAQQWSVGEEREVDVGVYMALFAENHGWRVWRSERKAGIRCYAVKAAIGLKQPMPAGFGELLEGPTPYLKIESSGAVLVGRFGQGGEWRVSGDRFWSAFPTSVSALPNGVSTIDVHIDTYRYPNLRRGIISERGEIDLKGVAWAAQQTAECIASTPTN